MINQTESHSGAAQPEAATANRGLKAGPADLAAAKLEQSHANESVAQTTIALTSPGQTAIVVKELLSQVEQLVSYQSAHIMLLEDDTLQLAAWRGYQAPATEKLIPNLTHLLAGSSLEAKAGRLRQPLLVPEAGPESPSNTAQAHLIFPIGLDDQVLGLLILQADRSGAFSPADVAGLQPLVVMAAVALETARRHDQAQQQISDHRRTEEVLQEGLEQARLAHKQALVYAQELTEAMNERKRVDKERRQLIAAIEQTAESIIITDTQGSVLYVNPAFERISGYSNSEVVGQNFVLLKAMYQDKRVFKEMLAIIQAGQVWQGHVVARRKDGTFYTNDTTVSPVRDKSGTVVNFVGVGRDITRELRLEEQYRQAQKMEAVGQLAGGIAHDFNNLLTIISGFTEITQAHLPPDHPSQEAIETVLDSCQRATELIRQLLTFSRQQVITPQVLNLNSVVANLDKMLGRVIGADIELQTRLADSLDAVKVDPSQLEQVIINLALNAVDAMPEGGQLIIETANVVLDKSYLAEHADAQPGDYVMLAVSDTGTGMTGEVKARIFEPFFTTKELGKGTGLGLATVFGIVKQSGGHISVYSEVDCGTSFKIYLPGIKEAVPLVSQPAQRQPDELPGGAETVLLVEDEVKIRDLGQRLLHRQGYTVLTAANGEEALRVGEQHAGKIDLLLTDMVMPQMNGKVLAEHFRALQPDIKILFTSGYTDRGIVRQGMLDADVAFIQKPFSITELAQKVRKILDD